MCRFGIAQCLILLDLTIQHFKCMAQWPSVYINSIANRQSLLKCNIYYIILYIYTHLKFDVNIFPRMSLSVMKHIIRNLGCALLGIYSISIRCEEVGSEQTWTQTWHRTLMHVCILAQKNYINWKVKLDETWLHTQLTKAKLPMDCSDFYPQHITFKSPMHLGRLFCRIGWKEVGASETTPTKEARLLMLESHERGRIQSADGSTQMAKKCDGKGSKLRTHDKTPKTIEM